VGQLTGGIAHDFNNLLTVIIGNLDIVQGSIENAPVREAAGTAMRSAVRAATLVRRLLAFSRQQPLQPAPVDLNQLVEDMGELIRRAVGARIACVPTLAPDLPPAFCDAHQLESALLNLVLNARDAMPSGGRLIIATAAARVAEGEKVGLDGGDYLVLTVADDGVGMTEEVRQRAFEPFFTTKEAGKGSGLGLSMVYGFLTQSGGQIEIASQPGAGTEIRLFLPCRDVAAVEELPRAEAASP
jgi:signal transduction histidine kinase